MAAEHKKAIGRRIAELRNARRWSQPQLAAKIPAQEVDAQQVSKWERGVHTPRKHLPALAKALGVEEGDILAGDRQNGGPTPDVLSEFDSDQARAVLDRLANIEAQLAELVKRDALRDAEGAADETARRLAPKRRPAAEAKREARGH